MILFLSVLYIVYLIYEYYSLSVMRKGFRHIIHVNGTRGKSTVCRLIDAGMRAGGNKVFTKTTGTSPRMLYVDGSEHELKRRGRANIKEQIGVIREARAQGAEILVIECMAVKPGLQEISQERLVAADIGVITNVRPDHLDEMGKTLDDIAEALSSTIPVKGRLFTADFKYFDFFKKAAEEKATVAFCAEEGSEAWDEIDFRDNVSLALEVCESLGVHKETALSGMRNYKKDPGSLKVYSRRNRGNKELTFVNALAVNDTESAQSIMEQVFLKVGQGDGNRVLLINNREDRLTRMQQFCDFAVQSKDCFDSIWISGPLKHLMRKMLIKGGIPEGSIKAINSLEELEQYPEDVSVFAVGNINGFGKDLLKYMEGAGGVLGR